MGKTPIGPVGLGRCPFSLGIAVLFWVSPAIGGIASFDVNPAGQTINLTNTGDSPVYAPSAFALRAGEEWLPLPPKQKTAFQWRPQETLSFSRAPLDNVRSFAPLHALMICFFDQTGVEFGQLAFLNPPPRLDGLVNARYKNGKLYVRAPEGNRRIIATWVLWGPGQGITPIAHPLKLQHIPPRPRYIRWANVGGATQTINTGRGLPAVYLIHQVTSDKPRFVLQVVQEGIRDSEQTARWLREGPTFYRIGGSLLTAGMITLLIPAARALHKQRR